MPQVQKATLRDKGRGTALVLPYNPETVEQSGSASYEQVPAAPGHNGLQWVGTSSRSVSLQVRLDARAEKVPVWTRVETLFSWLEPTSASADKHKPSPPLLSFSWGRQDWFDVHLTSLSCTYTMFDPDGTPTRATLGLSLDRVQLAVPKQNPTSGSAAAQRVRLLVAGESLHSLAWQEYGDVGRWRDLALVNDIDDPLAVQPGDQVLIPPLAALPGAVR